MLKLKFIFIIFLILLVIVGLFFISSSFKKSKNENMVGGVIHTGTASQISLNDIDYYNTFNTIGLQFFVLMTSTFGNNSYRTDQSTFQSLFVGDTISTNGQIATISGNFTYDYDNNGSLEYFIVCSSSLLTTNHQ